MLDRSGAGRGDSLWTEWPNILGQLQRAEHLLVATDFDGTLSPIADTPDQARIPSAARGALQRLSETSRCTVAIVTGRGLRDIESLVGIRGLYYAANHGMEIDGPSGFRYVDTEGALVRELLQSIVADLSTRLLPIEGAWMEDKGASLAVHYRQVTPASRADTVRAVFDATARVRASGRIVVREGNKLAVEIVPALGATKGSAIDAIAAHVAAQVGATPFLIYLGDDLTDEDGFEAVNRADGISVVVGAGGRPSLARYAIDSSDDTTEFMVRLADLLAE
ncbi:MAG: trehalose-phosphatase [Chloroflexi bacterium]|nr:trehalose-phosphatase [Chloroflexota bacterium]